MQTYGTLRAWVYHGLLEGNLKSDIATLYLYTLVSKDRNILLNSLLAGESGENISIKRLFRRTGQDHDLADKYDGKVDNSVRAKEDSWMLVYIACVYRLVLSKFEAYTDIISTKI